MESEINEGEGRLAPLKKVTPLSKYLAMVLFILMPFIGGWVGYTYAPDKIVEVEKVVFKEIEVPMVSTEDAVSINPNLTLRDGWDLYTSNKYNFSFEYPTETIISEFKDGSEGENSIVSIIETEHGVVINGLNDIFSPSLEVVPNTNRTSLEEERVRLSAYPYGSTRESNLIDGEDSFIYSGEMSENYAVVVTDDFIYKFHTFGLWEKDNIIDTFIFLD